MGVEPVRKAARSGHIRFGCDLIRGNFLCKPVACIAADDLIS
jgi:hypothetical protein